MIAKRCKGLLFQSDTLHVYVITKTDQRVFAEGNTDQADREKRKQNGKLFRACEIWQGRLITVISSVHHTGIKQAFEHLLTDLWVSGRIEQMLIFVQKYQSIHHHFLETIPLVVDNVSASLMRDLAGQAHHCHLQHPPHWDQTSF